MAVLGTIVLWMLGIAGGVIALVLLMPLRLEAEGAVAPWRASGRVDASWAWGLLGVRADSDRNVQLRLLWLGVYRFRAGAERESKAEKAERKRRAKDKPKKRRKRGLRWAWRNRHLAFRLLRSLRLRGRLRGTIGTGDPADTAQLSILMGPSMLGAALRPAARRLPGLDTQVVWNYIDEVLFVDGAVQARIWPAQLVTIVVTALVRGESRRALLATS